LGKAGGAAACAAVERTFAALDQPPHYALRHLTRWPAGTAYSAMAEEVAALLVRLAKASDPAALAPRLLVDVGCSDYVADYFFRQRGPAWAHGLLVTTEPSPMLVPVEGSNWLKVAASELAGCVLGLTQEGRLSVGDVPGAEEVVATLRAFGARAGEFGRLAGLSFGAASGEELVTAAAAPLWFGEQAGPPTPMPKPVPEPARDHIIWLTPRRDSRASQRGLFGATRPDPEGYRPA
jgi:hypothetical protein